MRIAFTYSISSRVYDITEDGPSPEFHRDLTKAAHRYSEPHRWAERFWQKRVNLGDRPWSFSAALSGAREWQQTRKEGGGDARSEDTHRLIGSRELHVAVFGKSNLLERSAVPYPGNRRTGDRRTEDRRTAAQLSRAPRSGPGDICIETGRQFFRTGMIKVQVKTLFSRL